MVTDDFNRRKVDLDFYLHRVFRKTSFRPLQREVIAAAIEGHDVFLQASTSFGKSLCFQLPAVISHGVTVVVSPLLALMTDQVNALQAIGVPVATINSTTSVSERKVIREDLLSGHPRTRLLYVTPELCLTETFRRSLQIIHSQGELTRVAIDEAHCISQWGHDFRTAYKELAWFKRTLKNPTVPISAFTATATPRVREDIIAILGLDVSQLKIFNTPSARPNIHYEIRYLEDYAEDPLCPEDFQVDDLVSWLDSIKTRREARFGSAAANLSPISGIVYVNYRATSVDLANKLSERSDSVNAVAYHAGLSSEDRTRIQTMWMSPQTHSENPDKPNPAFSIIVATNAFGMGIDNPDVRFVVHWTPSRSFEGFVQESGRAGRDGRAAASLVYYNTQERDRVLDHLEKDVTKARNRAGVSKGQPGNADHRANLQSHKARLESFRNVVRYCESTTRCRHEIIKEFFGDFELEQMGSQVPRNEGDAPESSSPCDFACDFCKEGRSALAIRKAKMVPPSNPDGFIEMSFLPYMQFLFPNGFR
ncbi:hypothetical protein ASPWEDRAFT_64430 [Aspergillus wentii DTO 134E9]|uniref:ATP-dependent DNA helicase n=1 Tax=Aspergillus wentii DTO 134E9 TaxID=1073089 RepID=A0A1L9S1V3_ASPWE|nr:uncharacterized protein ASPWEDRAFT_64430 [Aspergillus wentii DTO 134E9]OJJ41133.1 hypothetical protein ASPWEDRAFT_64430 [Aspergillus wentii DTO 134E9]